MIVHPIDAIRALETNILWTILEKFVQEYMSPTNLLSCFGLDVLS